MCYKNSNHRLHLNLHIQINQKTIDILGCSFDEFKKLFRNKFDKICVGIIMPHIGQLII